MVAVGPGLAGTLLGAGGFAMNPLPIQPAKIHCPPPRSDTLSRERLNSWLDRASAGRLALIIAEAGFGKTTLLADWAGQTSRRTTWYRLESDDRDWLTFIRHLVAGGRELDPAFAPDTFALLLALGPGGPSPDDLTQSIARELAEFGAASPHGFTLILDDYHVVDGCDETDAIVKALVDRTGTGFSLAIATRSMPKLAIGRLRARGAVLTLEGPDLCFDVDETARLFRDAYHHPLDADVVVDLRARTEGWAALLTLVRTSLEEHDDARALVAHLDASRGDLYEFLAEEVLAALPLELQRFLERVALLTAVDVDMAALVDPRPEEAIRGSIAESERLGLLARPDRETPHRFHPLVREFLVARLTAEIGTTAVRDLHLRLGRALEGSNWYAAAWHYTAAGDQASAARTVDAAVPSILAAGHFERARQFLDGSAGSIDRPAALMLRSRLELARGSVQRATELAQEASEGAEGTSQAGLTLLNLTAILARHGFDSRAIALVGRALEGDLSAAERRVAEASVAVWGAQGEGDLAAVVDFLGTLAIEQDAAGHTRYAGVTRVNQAVALLWLGRPRDAIVAAGRAEVSLSSQPMSAERVAAIAVRAGALVQLGDTSELERLAVLMETASTATARDEAAVEAARLFGDYGSIDRASSAADRISPSGLAAGYRGAWAAVLGTLALRRGDPAAAGDALRLSGFTLQDAAGAFRIGLLQLRISLVQGDDDVDRQIANLERVASAQGSRLEALLVRLARGLREGDADPAVSELLPDETHLLSVLAEEVVRELPRLGTLARQRVAAEARLRPERWTSALRLTYQSDPIGARLLAEIGGEADAAAMRTSAASHRWLKPLAAEMTRRLASSIVIQDLGPVSVLVGSAPEPRMLRRKVLALLCFLASRPSMACTRDEALDAIWPDLGPDTATNSLHQTIYYLRRVFDPDYKEGISARYVEFDGDVLSLDRQLVDSSSRLCWRLISKARAGDIAAVDDLVGAYRGMFALDFAYEDWAANYRENLHAAVLGVVEGAIRAANMRDEIDRAIGYAHAVLAVDPTADAIELELLRAYKRGAHHAAAAEQYAHYASQVRSELGVEPPSFDEI